MPFTLWCAGRHPTDYQAAVRATVSAGGDADTTCAIVGGIVAARTGAGSIPAEWRGASEAPPRWAEAAEA